MNITEANRIVNLVLIVMVLVIIAAVIGIGVTLHTETELQNHINCIVSLFGKPDRAQLVINNIQHCTLTKG